MKETSRVARCVSTNTVASFLREGFFPIPGTTLLRPGFVVAHNDCISDVGILVPRHVHVFEQLLHVHGHTLNFHSMTSIQFSFHSVTSYQLSSRAFRLQHHPSSVIGNEEGLGASPFDTPSLTAEALRDPEAAPGKVVL